MVPSTLAVIETVLLTATGFGVAITLVVTGPWVPTRVKDLEIDNEGIVTVSIYVSSGFRLTWVTYGPQAPLLSSLLNFTAKLGLSLST